MRKIIVPLLLAVMLLLAGCTQATGIALNKLSEKEVELQAYEGKLSVSFRFDLDEEVIPALMSYEKRALDRYRALNGVKLTLTDMKVNHVTSSWSAKGLLQKDGSSIPFHLYMKDGQAAAQVKGAKDTLLFGKSVARVFAPTNLLYSVPLLGYASDYVMEGTHTSKEAIVQELLKLSLSNLPTAKGLTVKPSGKSYGGVETSFHANGAELLELVRSHLRNIALDDQGLRQLASVIHEYITAEFKNQPEGFAAFYDDKQMSVEGIYGVEKALLAFLSLNKPDESDLQELQNVQASVTLNVDSNQMARGIDLKISAGNLLSEYSGLRGGEIQLSYERVKISDGESTVPDALSLTDGIQLNDLDTSEKLLQQVDETSALYRFLKNDLKLTRKSITMYVMDQSYVLDRTRVLLASGDYRSNPPVFISDNTAYVPARILAYNLGYGSPILELDQEEVTVEAGSQTISFSANSGQAQVNGESVEMPGPAKHMGGIMFVPLRFLAEQLGARVVVPEGELYSILVERD
jgi:hypothetical protein